MPPTRGVGEQSSNWSEAQAATAKIGGGLFASKTPSRRLAGALAVGMLTAGIVAGVALGPGPASSPADSLTLAQHAIAALVAQADSHARASPPTKSLVAPSESKAGVKATIHKANSRSSTASSKTGVPPSPEGSSSQDSSSATQSPKVPPSETSSPEGSGGAEKSAPGTPIKLPPIKHVWLIELSQQNLSTALEQVHSDPYLAKQLAPRGTLLSGYKLSASSSLANGIALLSGQGVNLDTEQNCPSFLELQPPTINPTNGLAEGVGCVYPQAIKTLPDELTAAGLTWKAYVQGMVNGQSSAQATDAPAVAGGPDAASAPTQPQSSGCRHPEVGVLDPNHVPNPGDPYLTFRNPFVYFHSLLDGGACAGNDGDLSRLQGDLATPADTPNLSWIVPSACNDGSGAPCAPGAKAGLASADSFLEVVVPGILSTKAYRKEGLIAIVPDSTPTSSANAAVKPVGVLLISPFVHGGAHVSESLNDFSLLKSLARLFGVLPLGHANDPSAMSFGASIYRTTK